MRRGNSDLCGRAGPAAAVEMNKEGGGAAHEAERWGGGAPTATGAEYLLDSGMEEAPLGCVSAMVAAGSWWSGGGAEAVVTGWDGGGKLGLVTSPPS